MGLELGDPVRVLGCGCEDVSHAGRHGIVSSLGIVNRLRTTFADEVLLNESLRFPEPPLSEVCADPLYLELL